MEQTDKFDEQFVQLIIGLQSTVWISLGKVMNPRTGKVEVNIDMARDSIDTLLMLKEKTKGNLNETEKGLLENSMQDLEMNFLEVSKKESAKDSSDKKENETKKNPTQ